MLEKIIKYTSSIIKVSFLEMTYPTIELISTGILFFEYTFFLYVRSFLLSVSFWTYANEILSLLQRKIDPASAFEKRLAA